MHQIRQITKTGVKKVLTPFISIQIGGTTKDQLIADIETGSAKISLYGMGIMKNQKVIISPEVGTVDLVTLAIGADLGFTEQPKTSEFMTAEFCSRWSEENLDGYAIELCQPEDGPQLRSQWKNQQKYMVVWMAMELITHSSGRRGLFCLDHDYYNHQWLRASWDLPSADEWFRDRPIPESRWLLDSLMIFRFLKIT